MDEAAARRLLAAERERTAGRLARLRGEYQGFVEASRDTNADDEHDPEGTTIAFERSQVGALTRQTLEHLVEVDAAYARLDAQCFGRCPHCGRMIPEERLAARPTARTCVGCA